MCKEAAGEELAGGTRYFCIGLFIATSADQALLPGPGALL